MDISKIKEYNDLTYKMQSTKNNKGVIDLLDNQLHILDDIIPEKESAWLYSRLGTAIYSVYKYDSKSYLKNDNNYILSTQAGAERAIKALKIALEYSLKDITSQCYCFSLSGLSDVYYNETIAAEEYSKYDNNYKEYHENCRKNAIDVCICILNLQLNEKHLHRHVLQYQRICTLYYSANNIDGLIEYSNSFHEFMKYALVTFGTVSVSELSIGIFLSHYYYRASIIINKLYADLWNDETYNIIGQTAVESIKFSLPQTIRVINDAYQSLMWYSVNDLQFALNKKTYKLDEGFKEKIVGVFKNRSRYSKEPPKTAQTYKLFADILILLFAYKKKQGEINNTYYSICKSMLMMLRDTFKSDTTIIDKISLLYIINGEYTAAIDNIKHSNFELNKNDYGTNCACMLSYAQLINGNRDGAIKSFENICDKDKNSPLCNYLKQILER